MTRRRLVRDGGFVLVVAGVITAVFLVLDTPEARVEADRMDNVDARPLPDVDVEVARDLLADLEGRTRESDSDYDRDAFGPAWYDADSNGCDARNDILARDLVDSMVDRDECTVLTGVLVYEPYLGEWHVEFQRGDSDKGLDNEHIVASATPG